MREISWPPKKSWKLRCLSARRVTGRLRPRDFAGGAPGFVGFEGGTELTFHDAVETYSDANCTRQDGSLLFTSPNGILTLECLPDDER
jgi:hypothetical protein